MKTKKQFSMTALAIVAIVALALAFIGCDNGDDKNDPPPPQNGTITFHDKSITVDYSNSGLTQAQADTVTPKLQSIFTGYATLDLSDPTVGGKLVTMVNRSGFKIVIILGNSGCARVGDNMTLGADFVLDDISVIRSSISAAIISNDVFADPPTPCICPEGTTHEPNQKCCEGTDCNCQIAEPEEREFTANFNFFTSVSDEFYNATVTDERTACGSADLENVKVNDNNIITIIEEAVMGAFTTVATNNPNKNRFRTVFGVEGGVTIIVNNPETPYKMRATDKNTIYIHIDYLKSTPVDIQQGVFGMVVAMNGGGDNLPYEAE